VNKKEIFFFGVTLVGGLLLTYYSFHTSNERLAGYLQNGAWTMFAAFLIGGLLDVGYKKIFG